MQLADAVAARLIRLPACCRGPSKRFSCATGQFEGLCSPLGRPRIMAGTAVKAVRWTPSDAKPAGVVGPLARCEGEMGPGAMMVLLCAKLDLKHGAERAAGEVALCEYLQRIRTESTEPMELASDAATWARGKLPSLSQGDLAVAIVQRGG